ncbi:RPA-related protein RADX isoform X4 [Parasteatoda tepidariorum]|uniref:RPA-related protein RADX isoform X4 n=1 Tax=Parasteatoda tepidariorum TaxID=114398 RepID=UPI0039BCD436
MAGNLRRLRSVLREYKLISDSSRVPGDFQVISIYCYSADLNFLKALTPPLEDEKKEVIYLYDVLLTDGAEKLKCFLALPLGHLVQKNVIKIGIHVQIEKAKLCYLEGEYNDSHIVQYVFLEALKIVEYDPIILPDLGAIRFTESVNYRETDLVPLVTGRKCYVNPWIPVLPYGEECTDNSAFEYNEDEDVPQNISSLQDLADDWMRLPKPYPTLFVRVLARGILHYYGFNKNDRSHPFLSKIVVGDSASTCHCVVFGKLSLPLYYNATPGTILLIENYTIAKPLKLLLPRLRGNAGNLNSLDIEIIIGDTSKVKIVPPDNNVLLMQITLLPVVEFSFGDRASLELAANESTIDIVGLITYVSLFHRFVYKFGKIHARVYVELVDSSSQLPFVVILYDNGLRFPVDDLHPGQVLVATHLKVCHLPDDVLSSFNVRTYVKATHYTEMIPGAYWKTALESLSYRERRCVTLGGFIIQVDYCDMQTVDSQQPVYGWSYAENIATRRTIFVNIKARYKLGNLDVLNPVQNVKSLFPSQYSSQNEEIFKAYRQFPACDAANWTPSSDEELENLPVLTEGYYVITIASLHYQAILQCIMIPEPSAKPHPSLLEALNGDFLPLPCKNIGVFLNEPPKYTWDEVQEISRTASEVSNRTFVFAIELHRLKSNVIMAHMKRAYICPPDQLQEALADDIVQ